jgi:4-phytase/acid phosphatase
MRFLFVAIAALTALIVHSPEPASAGELKLEAAVIFSRHGVRAPLYPNDELDAFSDTAWPDFGVEPGELMPNGFDAAQQMGAYYGAYFRDGGLLPATGCPKAKKIWFRSDNSQRTYETAVALRNGMLPGCDYDIQSLPINVPDKPVDPLFDPVNANICTPNDTRLNLAWEASLGRSSDAVADANAYSLEALQDVLQCCQPSLCAEAGLPAGCTLLDLPSTEKILGYATNLSENFLMEYTANMSLSDVGWGRITDNNQLSFINAVHALEFYASNADAYN